MAKVKTALPFLLGVLAILALVFLGHAQTVTLPSTPAAGSFSTLSATGQITSTLATGTAPFSIASTTPVANLVAAGNPVVIASGGATTPSTLLTTNTCSTVVTVSAPNVTTSDAVEWAWQAAISSPNALLTMHAYVTAGNVNFLQCNPTSSSQTPVAATINWRVVR
jgi:hypothetical protein